MRDPIPDHLSAAYGRITESVAELDTIIARANEMPMPEFEPVDPALLAEAAKDPSAPPELRAVAKAVAEGRTTWAEVASGGGRDLPEIRDLHQAGAERVGRELEAQLHGQGDQPAATPTPPATPPRRTRPRPSDADEDYSERTIFREDSW